jgi:hypothetical protein
VKFSVHSCSLWGRHKQIIKLMKVCACSSAAAPSIKSKHHQPRGGESAVWD